MKSFLKEYFSYSKSERYGLLVLFIIIVLVFIAPIFIKYFTNDKTFDYSEFAEQIKALEYQNTDNEKKVKEAITYFNFDPNTISEGQMQKLGLSKKQIKTIENYRKAGGVFKSKTDLAKIYTIGKIEYNRLEPYIVIKQKEQHESVKASNSSTPKKTKYASNENKVESKPATIVIELNSADSIKLIRLSGIGKTLARRIINYRSFLGGFQNKEQLLEVYGVKPEVFNEISENLIIDSTAIVKINLNEANFKTLNKHPYISYASTKTILKYRNLMKSFKSVNDLIEYKLVDSITYVKVEPYLTVQ